MNFRVYITFPLSAEAFALPPEELETFTNWISQELSRLIQPSESFNRKFGSDWRIRIDFGSTFVGDETKTHVTTYRRQKEIEIIIVVPNEWYKTLDTSHCSQLMTIFFESLAPVLKRLDLDPAPMMKASPQLIEHIISDREMLKDLGLDKSPRTNLPIVSTVENVSQSVKEKTVTRKPSKKSKKRNDFAMPKWKIPKNIQKRVEDEDGMWEDERFDPILLTVISGTSYEDRDIPLAWQIEFDPFDDRFEDANARLQASGIEPDGDGWAEVIEKKFVKRYPKLKDELHSDSESSTCVLWVESESSCKKLIELVWSLISLK